MTTKKQPKKKNNSRFGTDDTVCSGCINIFQEKQLTSVLIKNMYTTPYCDKCLIEYNVPKSDIKGNYFELRLAQTKKHNSQSEEYSD